MSHTQRLAGWPLWLCLFFLRTLNAIFLRTYFDPDEYWQTIEVAHHAIFGYGWLSWEWIIGLRSILSVIPFIAYFQVIQLFALDSDITIVIFSKISSEFIDLWPKNNTGLHRCILRLLGLQVGKSSIQKVLCRRFYTHDDAH